MCLWNLNGTQTHSAVKSDIKARPTNAHTHMLLHTHSHTHAHARTHPLTQTFTHMCSNTITHTLIYPHVLKHMQTPFLLLTQTLTFYLSHTHSHIFTKHTLRMPKICVGKELTAKSVLPFMLATECHKAWLHFSPPWKWLENYCAWWWAQETSWLVHRVVNSNQLLLAKAYLSSFTLFELV